MTPLVSVIVPIHNGERFLGEALDSIAAQDYDAVEVIVVDDGSSDGGPSLAATRDVVLLRQERRGVASARNAGLDRARGEIVAFLDQDDLWMPLKLRRQVDVLTAHPDSVCLVQLSYFLESGVAPPPWFGKRELLVGDHTGWAPSSVAVCRELFDRVGRFDERLQHGSDLDWSARALQMGIAVEVVPEMLVRHRIHERNDSATPAAMTDMFTVLRGALARRRS